MKTIIKSAIKAIAAAVAAKPENACANYGYYDRFAGISTPYTPDQK